MVRTIGVKDGDHGRGKEATAAIKTRAAATQPEVRQGRRPHHPRSDVLGLLLCFQQIGMLSEQSPASSGTTVIGKERDSSTDSRFYLALQAFLTKALCGGIADPPALLSPSMSHMTPVSQPLSSPRHRFRKNQPSTLRHCPLSAPYGNRGFRNPRTLADC